MMTRHERVQRVTLLCQHFARNLAYYRVAWNGKKLSPSRSQFWLTVNGNCLDISVLEWCKLFGDKKGPHYWGAIVSDPNAFEADMLRDLKTAKADFETQIMKMRDYRDKFVAHLDSDNTMNHPPLDIPKAAVWFYHAHLAVSERSGAELVGGFVNLAHYYDECEHEARNVYSKFR